MNNTYINASLLSILIAGTLFSIPTFLFAGAGILLFNNPVLAGIFPFIIMVTGLSLYHYLNHRFPKNGLEKFSLSLSNLLLGICIALLFFGYMRWYTAITFLTLFALLLYIEYVNKLRFMYRFYRVYLLLLIPFYLICRTVTAKGILKFNEDTTLKLKPGAVSIEAYFYFMAMLLTAVYLFELFKSKMKKA